MKPDRTNYEIWFIDYLDGNLSDSDAGLLFSFLEENPDLKEEFNELTKYNINPPVFQFPNKDLLRKSFNDINESQFDYLCVAGTEGDLNEEQAKELAAAVENDPEKRRNYDIIRKIKLSAPAVEFRYKSRIKKLTLPAKIIRISVIGLSAAASVLLLFSILNQTPSVVKPIITAEIPALDTAGSALPVTTQKDNVIKTPAAINPGQENSVAGSRLAEVTIPETIAENLFITGQTAADSTAEPLQTGKVVISSIAFRTEVKLTGSGLYGSLVAINTPVSYSRQDDEAPGFNDFIARIFREKILKSDNPSQGELKVYEIADAGINGLNKLLGLNMSLDENIDENGDVTSVYFNSRLIKFNAPVKKDESAQ